MTETILQIKSLFERCNKDLEEFKKPKNGQSEAQSTNVEGAVPLEKSFIVDASFNFTDLNSLNYEQIKTNLKCLLEKMNDIKTELNVPEPSSYVQLVHSESLHSNPKYGSNDLWIIRTYNDCIFYF